MHKLTRSLMLHLLMPYFVHLALALLLIRSVSEGGLAVILLMGGGITALGIALICIPFGLLHVLQAIYFAPDWSSPKKQFLVGLLNPSFAALTTVALFFLAPWSII